MIAVIAVRASVHSVVPLPDFMSIEPLGTNYYRMSHMAVEYVKIPSIQIVGNGDSSEGPLSCHSAICIVHLSCKLLVKGLRTCIARYMVRATPVAII